MALAGLPSRGSAADRPQPAGDAEGQGRAATQGELPPLESFKYDLDGSPGGKAMAGGRAKEVTVAEFPISKSVAGVSMHLDPGGLRELHWHAIAAEWGYVIDGNCRTTVLSPRGEAEVNDFGPGDVWYFPKGHPHSIQGLGPGDCHFVLVFDDGRFSEFGTFSITDWLAHTPHEVLARNSGLASAAISSLPKGEVYIVKGKVPPTYLEQAPLRNGSPIWEQQTHKFRLGQQRPNVWAGGEEYIVDSHDFPIATTITGVILKLKPGGLRELHWHPNADEWQYYIRGRSRVTVFGAHGRIQTQEFGPGQVAFIQAGFGHYVEQIGPEQTEILITFPGGEYQEISLSTWLASNPAELLAENFGLSLADVAKMPVTRMAIAGPAKIKT
jgi:oxalate decarboxylase